MSASAQINPSPSIAHDIAVKHNVHDNDDIKNNKKQQDSLQIGKVNWNDISPMKLAVLTWATSAVEVGVTYPTWVLKTRQQIQVGAAQQSAREVMNSAWIDSRRSASKFGRLFFRGYGTYATLAMPSYVLYTGGYTWAKNELGFVSGHKENADSQPQNLWVSLSPLAAGLFADFLCLTTYVPVELVTQRMQVSQERHSLASIVGGVYKQRGISGFYQGFGATVVTSGIASGVVWLTYEHCKKALQKSAETLSIYQGNQSTVNTVVSMASGSIAASVANVVSNPFDVVKTRIQVSSSNAGNMRDFTVGMKDLFSKEGVRGAFTRGIGPKLCSAVPLGAFSSLAYEFILYFSMKDQISLEKAKQLEVSKSTSN